MVRDTDCGALAVPCAVRLKPPVVVPTSCSDSTPLLAVVVLQVRMFATRVHSLGSVPATSSWGGKVTVIVLPPAPTRAQAMSARNGICKPILPLSGAPTPVTPTSAQAATAGSSAMTAAMAMRMPGRTRRRHIGSPLSSTRAMLARSA